MHPSRGSRSRCRRSAAAGSWRESLRSHPWVCCTPWLLRFVRTPLTQSSAILVAFAADVRACVPPCRHDRGRVRGGSRAAVMEPRGQALRFSCGPGSQLRRQKSGPTRREAGCDGGCPGAICGTAGQVTRGETPASHTVTNRKPDRGWVPATGDETPTLMCMRSILGGLAQLHKRNSSQSSA